MLGRSTTKSSEQKCDKKNKNDKKLNMSKFEISNKRICNIILLYCMFGRSFLTK
jgi:hypothetical protein